MLVRSLQLTAVRNLAPVTLRPGPRFNVLAGENGQGKTNLLEAIYAVCTLRSFRTRRLADLIAFGRDEARLAAEVERGGSVRTYEVQLGPGGRRARLDDKLVREIGRYVGGFQVVLFAPEDLAVPRGSPAERRAFLDRAVFQRTPEYLAEAQAYDKVLKSRNALLKSMRERGTRDMAMLEVYDQQLSELGARRMVRRARLIDELAPRLERAFEAIARAEAPASMSYAPQLPAAAGRVALEEVSLAQELARALVSSRTVDLARAMTMVGPHRDDFELSFGGRPAAAFASQGQLRAMVLAWKVAELELLTDAHGEPPILLLDDVSSELDPRRNEYLFDFLRSKENQCFVTTTHPRHVVAGTGRVDFEVRSGVVTQQDLS
ncbi:MAG TPA: DNA replication/repair protein RecF [Kofleriaceae bacterium]|nr:DNA replication/repair protein RecF [Kofleriaceae bacterium]